MQESVKVTREGRVLVVVLDRPKANAIDLETSRKLGEAFVTLRDDPDLSVGVVTGGGEKIFSAGWDLKAVESGEMSTDNWWEDDYGPGGFAGLTELWDLNKPVIAALNGIVIGGGFELALGCDLLVAANLRGGAFTMESPAVAPIEDQLLFPATAILRGKPRA